MRAIREVYYYPDKRFYLFCRPFSYFEGEEPFHEVQVDWSPKGRLIAISMMGYSAAECRALLWKLEERYPGWGLGDLAERLAEKMKRPPTGVGQGRKWRFQYPCSKVGVAPVFLSGPRRPQVSDIFQEKIVALHDGRRMKVQYHHLFRSAFVRLRAGKPKSKRGRISFNGAGQPCQVLLSRGSLKQSAQRLTIMAKAQGLPELKRAARELLKFKPPPARPKPACAHGCRRHPKVNRVAFSAAKRLIPHLTVTGSSFELSFERHPRTVGQELAPGVAAARKEGRIAWVSIFRACPLEAAEIFKELDAEKADSRLRKASQELVRRYGLKGIGREQGALLRRRSKFGSGLGRWRGPVENFSVVSI